MNIASVRRPIIPPAPPRAPDDMSFFGRLAVIRHNMIATWGQPAYEEDVIKGRFFLHNSFILNQPDAIRQRKVRLFREWIQAEMAAKE